MYTYDIRVFGRTGLRTGYTLLQKRKLCDKLAVHIYFAGDFAGKDAKREHGTEVKVLLGRHVSYRIPTGGRL